jgi:hypothetical protein
MTHRDLAVAVAAVVLGLTAACTGDGGRLDPSGAAGTGGAPSGGTTGSGGTAGSGRAGGAGGNAVDGGPPMVLSCLRDLYAACPETGACKATRTDASLDPTGFCYPETGVTSTYTVPGSFCSPRELRVYKPDGSLCYIRQSDRALPNAPICEGETIVWRNATGDAVARGETSVSFGLQIQCVASGENCSGAGCADGSNGRTSTCEPGTCP